MYYISVCLASIPHPRLAEPAAFSICVSSHLVDTLCECIDRRPQLSEIVHVLAGYKATRAWIMDVAKNNLPYTCRYLTPDGAIMQYPAIVYGCSMRSNNPSSKCLLENENNVNCYNAARLQGYTVRAIHNVADSRPRHVPRLSTIYQYCNAFIGAR
ncbi:hypothetical protein BC834DRAFT_403448 [Gloeopeniophorella convolvens]|nr:hypothetical protein BC834DRAFT_403448 [Gloeopeniophorella convolvens]